MYEADGASQQAEPSNLEDAFKMLRGDAAQGGAQPVAGGSVPEGDQGDAAEPEPAGAEVPAGEEPQEGAQVPEVPVQAEAPGDAGGPADGYAEVAGGSVTGFDQSDYQSIQDNLIDSIRRQAAAAANEQFQKNGITKWSLGQLYQRDEQTGRTTFTNPDDPEHPFTSRAEAQAWCDSINKQIEDEWLQYANAKQREFADQTLPAMRLLQFAPTYDSMPTDVQDTFETLIEPYSVRDSTGAVIGFSCDLEAMHQMAIRIESKHNGGAVARPPMTAPAEPALDATTTGTGTGKASGSEDDPKNLADAFKILSKKNKEARNAKQTR